MPYQTPKTWSFGDTVDAPSMQKYADNLNWFAGNLPNVPAQASGPHGRVFLRHAHRWLVYLPDSEDDAPSLTKFRDTSEDYQTTLETADDDGKAKWFDLDSLEWLVEGMAYTVTDVHFAREVATFS